MPSRALTVAVAAGVLLVATVAADASMNRTYRLEAHLDGRWIALASSPVDDLSRGMPSLVAFDLNASDEVPFRVVAENGYPWRLSTSYDLMVGGVSLHRGALDAPAFQEAKQEFAVPARSLMTQAGGYPLEKPGGAADRLWSPSITLEVAGEVLYGSVAFREVAR